MATETTKFMNRLLDLKFKPNAAAIAQDAVQGAVSVIVLEPGRVGRNAARILGWDGKEDCFRMDEAFRVELAKNSDAVTANWLKRDVAHPRVFVIVNEATLLVNHTQARGYYFEPGSLECQRV